MPVFAYKACNTMGSVIEGTLSADTPAAARRLLREQRVRVLDCTPVAFARKNRVTIRARKVRRQEQAGEFARQMGMLLRSGVPVVDAIDVLIKQPSGKMLPILRDVRERVASGCTLGEALEAHPAWFDGVFCSAVRVGQMSGQMDRALAELAAFMRERQNIKTKIFTAMAYPMLLSIVGLGVVLFLMSYVVPQLLTVLEASGQSLPPTTVFLKRFSDFLTGHWMLLTAIAIVLISAATALYRWPRGRRAIHAAQLSVPVLGPLFCKALVAQFAQTMALLLRSGVAFLDALRVMTGNAANLVLAGELEKMQVAIERGSDIAPTLADSKVFPPLVVHIVHVGQKTGELTEMLSQLREGFETEVRLAIGKATAVMEPLLIVLMSAVVGFIVFATMMPILQATSAIN